MKDLGCLVYYRNNTSANGSGIVLMGFHKDKWNTYHHLYLIREIAQYGGPGNVILKNESELYLDSNFSRQ